jgi:adenine phosphoribosyltransferase
LLADPAALEFVISSITDEFENSGIDAVAAIDARGFIFGAPTAMSLGVPLIPMRKPNKLPPDTIGVDYELEYGTARLEMRSNAMRRGTRVLIVDDLLATGGTAAAAGHLVTEMEAIVVACVFVVELSDLGGRAALAPHQVTSLVTY